MNIFPDQDFNDCFLKVVKWFLSFVFTNSSGMTQAHFSFSENENAVEEKSVSLIIEWYYEYDGYGVCAGYYFHSLCYTIYLFVC